MKTKTLRVIFCLVMLIISAVVLLGLIQHHQRELYIEQTTLREMLPNRPACAAYWGDDVEIRLSFDPPTALTELSYAVGDTEVAAVNYVQTSDQNETIISINAIGLGETEITVTDASGISATIPVTVIRKPIPPESDLPEFYYETIIIVNKQNPLSEDYTPPELMDIPTGDSGVKVNKPGMQLEPATLAAYESMYKDAYDAVKQYPILVSAYRSYHDQARLFNERVAKLQESGVSKAAAEASVSQGTQPPGCSEHQLGNSIDVSYSLKIPNGFANTKLGKWIHKNAHQYGFILRYPAGKTAITGISYESWHFRYVGVEHAIYIYEHKLCLEEYVNLQDEAAKAAEDYAARISAEEYLDLVS